ncbi:hypothetical protein ACFX1S_043776 [Malus domestica]
MASFRWLPQLHKDVQKAARFLRRRIGLYCQCLHSLTGGAPPLKLSFMQSPKLTLSSFSETGSMPPGFDRDHAMPNVNSSLLSFTMPAINQTVTKLMA